MKAREYTLKKEDIFRALYFIINKFIADTMHHQGTSSKRDLIGGFIDRWLNKAAEHLVFNKLLENKDYRVISDYFLYDNKSKKNAPDILGLVDSNGEFLVAFTHYNKEKWEQVNGMPFIEVKVLRSDQNMLTINKTQYYDDHYYAFVQSNLDPDYLLSAFNTELFDDEYLEQMKIPSELVKDDSDNNLLAMTKLSPKNDYGSIELLGIYKGIDVKKYGTIFKKKETVHYVISAEAVKTACRSNIEKPIEIRNGLYKYKYNGIKYLGFLIKKERKTELIKTFKSSCYLQSKGPIQINEFMLPAGITKIKFREFQRTSKWEELVCGKSIFNADSIKSHASKPIDRTDEIIKRFDEIVKNKRRFNETL